MKTNVAQWYEEGIVATLWPQLCGVDAYSAANSAHQRELLDQNFNEGNGKDWTAMQFIENKVDNYPWAVVGYIYSMAGDTEKGRKQLTYIQKLFADPEQAAHCSINEAGWALIHLGISSKK